MENTLKLPMILLAALLIFGANTAFTARSFVGAGNVSNFTPTIVKADSSNTYSFTLGFSSSSMSDKFGSFRITLPSGWSVSDAKVSPSNNKFWSLVSTSGTEVKARANDPDSRLNPGQYLQVSVIASASIGGKHLWTIKGYSDIKFSGDEFVFSALPSILVDDKAPNTTNSIASGPSFTDISSNIYVSSATVFSLLASDDGSGVAKTYYRFYRVVSTPPDYSSANSFSISGMDGAYTIEYYSVDNVGNVENIHSEIVFLDNTAPTSILAISQPKYSGNSMHVTSSTSFTITADDKGSGVATVYYKIDDGMPANYSGSFTLPATIGDGTHTIYFWGVDNLGNVEQQTY